MGTPRAWLLNFDADDELASFPEPYSPNPLARAWADRLKPQLTSLFGPGDVFVDHACHDEQSAIALGPKDANRYLGMAWSPTPNAIATMRALGMALTGPRPEILRAANDRAFVAALCQPLPSAIFTHSLEEAISHLRHSSPTGIWVAKRAFGLAGRGLRQFKGAVSDENAAWLAKSMAHSAGIQIEPWVTRVADYGLHGYLSKDGALARGRVTTQNADARGTWRETKLAEPSAISASDAHLLFEWLERSAAALHAIGYFGPFGIDAFQYEFANRITLNPICELNARYSMGWAIGMGNNRPDLI